MFADNVGQDMSFVAITVPGVGWTTADNVPSHANHSSPTVSAPGSRVIASEICAVSDGSAATGWDPGAHQDAGSSEWRARGARRHG